MVKFDAKELVAAFGLKNASVQGDELTCSCPMTANHKRGDSRPSFGIDLNRGLFNCFACGYSGNIIHLAQDLLGMSYLDAQSKFYGDITPDEITRMVNGEREEKRPMTPLEFDLSRWCPYMHPYWHARGFTEQTVGEWGLGYDREANRVVVPIYWRGELVGWTKRAVDDETKPKWLHSDGFQKGQVLFGLDKAVGDKLILVEAPLSVIMLSQQGIKNAVATFGASISDEQASILRGAANTILVYYDPDEAGKIGTRKVIDKLGKFLDVYAVSPTRDDPAAMSREENLAAIYETPVIAGWAYQ